MKRSCRLASIGLRLGCGLLVACGVARGQSGGTSIDEAAADRFAKLALACVDREYPNKPEHVLDGETDIRSVRAFHPAFFGCYDWHSSVHGHWMLVRLLAASPGDWPPAGEIRARLAPHFAKEAIAAEAVSPGCCSAR